MASNDVIIKLEGFKELAEGLKQLPANLSKKSLRRATSAGAAEIRREVKKNALAMKRSGTLARSVYQKQIRELSGLEKQTFYVGCRRGKKYQKLGKKQVSADAYYAPFVEFGHFTRQPHGGKRLRQTNRGQRNNAKLAEQVRTGQVKWVPPHPFIRPAVDTKAERAIQTIGEQLAVGLLSEADKIRIATGG